MRAAWVATSACLAALAFPAGAAAVKCAPPGTSGVDQYYETIPGASCNAAPPGSGSGTPGARNLSRGESRQLRSQGAAGRAVGRFVASTAPPIHRRGSEAAGHHPVAGRGGRAGRGATSRSPSGHGENPIVGALRPVVTGSGTGTGLLLPIVLAAAVLLALLVAAVRLRRPGRAPSGEP